jgi:peroxiredoxin
MRVLPVHLVLVATTLLVMASCKQEKKGSGIDNFAVSGTITNSKATTVYLEKIPIGKRDAEVVDSAKLGKDGQYALSAYAEESMIFNLRLDENKLPIASIVNDTSDIKVNIELANGTVNPLASKYEVKNSPGSEKIRDFIIAFNEQLKELNKISAVGDSLLKIQAPDSAYVPLKAAYRKQSTQIKDYTRQVVADNSSINPAVALYFLAYHQELANNPQIGLPPFSNKEITTLLTDVAGKFPSHKRLAEIKESIAQQEERRKMQETASVWLGKQAAEIALPDVNGKVVKLSSYRGKYVLVDFWASWCGPCRQENPNVVATFTKFKDKNFTILGVSLDDNKEKWLKAIQDDQLTWTHISDLKKWNSVVVAQYGFGEVGIPYNILVDPQGKIIGERLMGEELDAKLSELLK